MTNQHNHTIPPAQPSEFASAYEVLPESVIHYLGEYVTGKPGFESLPILPTALGYAGKLATAEIYLDQALRNPGQAAELLAESDLLFKAVKSGPDFDRSDETKILSAIAAGRVCEMGLYKSVYVRGELPYHQGVASAYAKNLHQAGKNMQLGRAKTSSNTIKSGMRALNNELSILLLLQRYAVNHYELTGSWLPMRSTISQMIGSAVNPFEPLNFKGGCDISVLSGGAESDLTEVTVAHKIRVADSPVAAKEVLDTTVFSIDHDLSTSRNSNRLGNGVIKDCLSEQPGDLKGSADRDRAARSLDARANRVIDRINETVTN